jgi:hypothetical protein
VGGSGTGGAVEQPLSWEDPVCEGFTVFRIRYMECAWIHGRFYITNTDNGYCGPEDPEYKGCSIWSNAGQYGDGEDGFVSIRAEPGREFAVDRFEMTSPDTGACPKSCN